MPVIINGTTGISGIDGSATSPAIQGTDTNTGMFFPAADTIAFAEGGSEVMRMTSNGVITTSLGGVQLVSETAKTASGTSIDFTGIPSWVKRITVMFYRISSNGTSPFQVQLGDSGGIENTGYETDSVYLNTNADNGVYTSGFVFRQVSGAAATGTYSGQLVLNLMDSSSNQWVCMGAIGWYSTLPIMLTVGSKSTSATLDRIRLTTVNGTDTFDAGTINIMYE